MSLVNFGHEDGISGNTDSGNSNIIIAQRVSLASAGTLQSLSFYVMTAGGDLALAVYAADGPTAPDTLGPGPGTLLDRVAAFTPTTGWNTQPALSHASLSIGNYWLAYEPQSGVLEYALFISGVSHPLFYNRTYDGVFDSTFSASPTDITDPIYWSFYGTVDTAGGGGGGTSTLIAPNTSGIIWPMRNRTANPGMGLIYPRPRTGNR